MRIHAYRFRYPLAAGLALGAMAAAAASAEQDQDLAIKDYITVTDTRRSTTNFNVETIRGMEFDDAGTLWAVNTHGSTLVAYDWDATDPGAPIAPLLQHRTLNNPSALALWTDTGGREFAIVVGGGTHGVVKQDRGTGEIVAYVGLPSEPMDIVIDPERDLAFISCGGSFDVFEATGPQSGGVVVQLELGSFDSTSVRNHFIDSVRPTFLSIDVNDGDVENFVYVAPLLSGNRTTFLIDGTGDGSAVVMNDLPDDDLFRITEGGLVEDWLDGVSTLLTAHGRNPSTGEYWMAGVDLFNAAQTSEPAHRGRFAENHVVVIDDTAPGMPVMQPRSLDGAAPSAFPAAADKPASFPFGLAFDGDGNGFVAGSTGDVVRHLDSSGVTQRSLGLPEGSIPRSLAVSPDERWLFVYAWGTNRLLRFDRQTLLDPSATSIGTPAQFDLGADPQPAAVKAGRELWYDADNSNDAFNNVPGKVSCNTCHPRGGADALGWELSDPPFDRKDLMVTQSLLSIEDTFPYHWRGERTLSDFNAGFFGILGGTPLAADDLADFEAFVFSLQAPANPRQNLDRRIDDARAVAVFTPPGGSQITGSATHGQILFHNEPDALSGFSPTSRCVDCHSAESGTNGLITPDVLSAIPSNANLETTHLRQLHHKIFQPIVTGNLGGVQVDRPRGGFGIAQDGQDLDVLDLLSPAVFFTQTGAQQNQFRADAASFVAQFDQGIAPRAHFAVQLDDPDVVAQVAEMTTQAAKGWIDLAAVGVINGGPSSVGLFYDPDVDRFRFTEVAAASFTFSDLQVLGAAGIFDLLFVGLPPGNAFRFAVDPDDDGLSNATEGGLGTEPNNPDSDGDMLSDGYETFTTHSPPLDPNIFNGNPLASDSALPTLGSQAEIFDHATGRIAKFFVTFSEPVTYDIQVLRFDPVAGTFGNFGPLQRRPGRRTFDTVVAQGLLPSIDGFAFRDDLYRIELQLRDEAGNTNTVTLPSGSPTASVQSRPAVVGTGIAASVVGAFTVSHSGNATTVTVDLDDVWDGATTTPGGTTPAGTLSNQKSLILQLLEETSPGEFTPVPLASITPVAPTRVESVLTVAATPVFTFGNPNDKIDGPFLVSDPTDGNGVATLSFTTSGITAGTNMRVVMLGAFESILPTVFAGFSPRFWQQPMTPPALRVQPFVF